MDGADKVKVKVRKAREEGKKNEGDVNIRVKKGPFNPLDIS